MLGIYLNSLYNLILHENPLAVMTRRSVTICRALLNIRRNMVLARSRYQMLDTRYRTMESYIDHPTPHTRHRFDITR